MTQRLDISVGPVQGFVSQSRRTRDLWGSSFLLAFLAAHAMRGAERAGGRVVQPMVDDDPLYLWVGGTTEGIPPPDRFVTESLRHRTERRAGGRGNESEGVPPSMRGEGYARRCGSALSATPATSALERRRSGIGRSVRSGS